MTSARNLAIVKSTQAFVLLCLAGCVAPSSRWLSPSQERIACYVEHPAPSDVACWPTTVYVMRGNGTGRHAVGEGMDPSWSPDGDQLVVGVDCGDPVFLLDPETGEATPLFTTGWRSAAGFAWSPDGGAIAFRVVNELYMYAMDEDGSDVQQLTDTPGQMVGTPSWSPAGDKIAYSLGSSTGLVDWRDEKRDIWVMNRDGSGKVRLTDGMGYYFNPVWSPVADRIAFSSHPGGEYHIVVMNGDGSGQERIGTGILYGWSPDGSRLYFHLPNDDTLWTMNTDGSNRTRLFKLDCEDPAWSPVLAE
jgi:Tol biopolymer transport system component